MRVFAGLPVQHSEYIESAMDLLVQPVVGGIHQLQRDAQLIVASTAVTALVDGWTSNVLARKIRFRYYAFLAMTLSESSTFSCS